MKAGTALGLLAGLGAMNALRGGRDGTGPRFTGLLDMIDGGGAGQSGDRFEGGGLLSMLGNLFAKPLEAQDRVERIAADTNATKAVTKTLEDMAKGGTLTSRLDGKDGLLSPAQKEQIVMDQIVNPDVYGIGQGGEFAGSMLAPRATTAQSAAMEDAYSTTAPLRQPAGTPTAPYEQTGAVTEVRFGPRGEPTSLLDTRQQAPSPDEARVMQKIVEGNMMPNFMDMEPYLQRAYVSRLIELGY